MRFQDFGSESHVKVNVVARSDSNVLVDLFGSRSDHKVGTTPAQRPERSRGSNDPWPRPRRCEPSAAGSPQFLRPQALAAIAALRGAGKRDVEAKLALLKGQTGSN